MQGKISYYRKTVPYSAILFPVRRRLRPAGAMQTENETWKIVWAVSSEQEKRWERRRVHGAKAVAFAA